MKQTLAALLVVVTFLTVAPAAPATAQPYIDPLLQPAWDWLMVTPDAGRFAGMAADSGASIVARMLPPRTYGRYEGGPNRITISLEAAVREDPRALAAVLAHELRHAFLSTPQGQAMMGAISRDGNSCLEDETRAFWEGAMVWGSFWRGEPPRRTDLEHELSAAWALVRDTASGKDTSWEIGVAVRASEHYRQQCAR